MNTLHAASTCIAAALVLGTAFAAEAANQCFYTDSIQNLRAPDDHTFYIRASGDRVFQFDMAGACPGLEGGSSHVIMRPVAGNGTICNAVDVDLKLRDNGIETACVVKEITKLTPDQIAALPRKVRP